MLDAFVTGKSRSRDFVAQIEAECDSCGLDTDPRFSDLKYALAVFNAGSLIYDEESLAHECRQALKLLRDEK